MVEEMLEFYFDKKTKVLIDSYVSKRQMSDALGLKLDAEAFSAFQKEYYGKRDNGFDSNIAVEERLH